MYKITYKYLKNDLKNKHNYVKIFIFRKNYSNKNNLP